VIEDVIVALLMVLGDSAGLLKKIGHHVGAHKPVALVEVDAGEFSEA
jgi:hypothetical protein